MVTKTLKKKKLREKAIKSRKEFVAGVEEYFTQLNDKKTFDPYLLGFIDQQLIKDFKNELSPLLIRMISIGKCDNIELLIKNGIDINQKNKIGYSPLHIAGIRNNTEVFNLLVSYGADTNSYDSLGNKPKDYIRTREMVFEYDGLPTI